MKLTAAFLFICFVVGLTAYGQIPIQRDAHAEPMPLVIPASVVWQMFAALLTALGVLGRLMWKKQSDEIKRVEEQLELTVDKETYEINRQEMRQNVHDLHTKVDRHHEEEMRVLLELQRR